MFDNPPMTVQQLFGDWTRRDGITFKALAVNTWVVRGKDGGRFYYSRSILADGIICTIEIAYDRDLADLFEPILARSGPSLMPLPGEGIRGKAERMTGAEPPKRREPPERQGREGTGSDLNPHPGVSAPLRPFPLVFSPRASGRVAKRSAHPNPERSSGTSY